METKQSKSREIAAPNHIIERPRLIKLMEDSGARVIVLHAPAGYGKTTLARQWSVHEGRTAAWYRCSPTSTDWLSLRRALPMLSRRFFQQQALGLWRACRHQAVLTTMRR